MFVFPIAISGKKIEPHICTNEKVRNEDEALQGARDIIAEWINENIYVRKQLRRLFQRKANIETKVVKKKAEDEGAYNFSQYFDWSENLS